MCVCLFAGLCVIMFRMCVFLCGCEYVPSVCVCVCVKYYAPLVLDKASHKHDLYTFSFQHLHSSCWLLNCKCVKYLHSE